MPVTDICNRICVFVEKVQKDAEIHRYELAGFLCHSLEIQLQPGHWILRHNKIKHQWCSNDKADSRPAKPFVRVQRGLGGGINSSV